MAWAILPLVYYLLNETGGYLLLESGGRIVIGGNHPLVDWTIEAESTV